MHPRWFTSWNSVGSEKVHIMETRATSLWASPTLALAIPSLRVMGRHKQYYWSGAEHAQPHGYGHLQQFYGPTLWSQSTWAVSWPARAFLHMDLNLGIGRDNVRLKTEMNRLIYHSRSIYRLIFCSFFYLCSKIKAKITKIVFYLTISFILIFAQY